MNLVSQYVIRVGAYILFSLLWEGILPQGSSKKMAKFMLSLMFLYVLVNPVINWLQSGMSLETLTTVDFEWEEETSLSERYQQQAEGMVETGWLQELQKSLPRELAREYEMVEIAMDENKERIQVKLARKDAVGSFDDRSLDLGEIGVSKEEEETIQNRLCEYWGIEKEKLELKLQ